MRNTGILLLLVGIYIVVNSGSFRDLVFGKAEIGFLKQNRDTSSSDETSADVTTHKQKGGKVAS